MTNLSRRKIAEYVASQVSDGVLPTDVLQEVAAYLVESGRVRESELLVRAVEDELEAKGVVIANVTSAHQLTNDDKQAIKQMLQGETVYFRESVDQKVIGGVRIQTPGATLDATISNKLQALSRAKL